MKKQQNKKVMLILGMLTLLVVGIIFAFFQKSESIDNKFQTAEAKINLTEKFDPNDRWVPGEEKQKEVRFGNEGTVASVLRVKFTPVLKLENGTEDTEATKEFKLNFAENFQENWTDGGDGWYYYNKILDPDQMTDITLKSVTISDQIGNDEHGIETDYSGASYDVKIEGELLQASLASEAAEYMKWGLIPSVTEDVVTWN